MCQGCGLNIELKMTLRSLVLGVLGSSVLYWKFLAPSGNIDHYSRYYHKESSALKPGGVKVTFLGTTTLLLDDGETQLMTDGFFTRPSLWRVATSKLVTNRTIVDAILSRMKIERLKAVFVAHSHYDHAFDSAYVVRRTGAKLYGSLSTLNIGLGAGLTHKQMALYEPGKEMRFGKFRVTILNSKHSPAKPFNCDLGKMITVPLSQPAKASAYKEGGSYDMLITHGTHTFLIKPSANFVDGALNDVRADVVFLGTATLGDQDRGYQDAYYAQTIGTVQPELVIPIHWDNFFLPLSGHLQAPMKALDDLADSFDFLIARTQADGVAFRILQGYQSVVLFTDGEEDW